MPLDEAIEFTWGGVKFDGKLSRWELLFLVEKINEFLLEKAEDWEEEPSDAA